MVFSLILLAPSWGGMINGIMTLSGAWDKLRDDPVIRFMIVSLSFYGMSTFEGPMMSIKTVNALSHFTDWTVGHVHSGALGWVAMMTIGCSLLLDSATLGQDQMWSVRLINTHFWLSTIGVIFYVANMWIAGVMQGLMWRAVNEDGTLTNTFVQSLEATWPFYVGRLCRGHDLLLRHAGHGLQHHGRRSRRARPRRDPTPPWRRGDPMNHDVIEKNIALMVVLIVVGDQPRRSGGDRSALLGRRSRRAGRGPAAPDARSSSKAGTSTSARAASAATPR